MPQNPAVPVVLTLSGNDPSGGAGIQADIETLASMGCHCAPVITALTVQDTSAVHNFSAVSADLVLAQAQAVLEDMPVAAFKLGMLGSLENVEAAHELLSAFPDTPVVLDPVATAGGGGSRGGEAVLEAIRKLLLPLTTVLTPNSPEARALAPRGATLDECARELLAHGCGYVLVTGTHEETDQVENRLYTGGDLLETFFWERLGGSYHGSGCTLASAIAGLLAVGLEPFTAVHEAQEYTWEALRQGYRIGRGQYLPNRLFWARDEEEAPAPATLQ
jgi:hydroxymethylpyrimidine/phosphomethylpyrimidine kinase